MRELLAHPRSALGSLEAFAPHQNLPSCAERWRENASERETERQPTKRERERERATMILFSSCLFFSVPSLCLFEQRASLCVFARSVCTLLVPTG